MSAPASSSPAQPLAAYSSRGGWQQGMLQQPAGPNACRPRRSRRRRKLPHPTTCAGAPPSCPPSSRRCSKCCSELPPLPSDVLKACEEKEEKRLEEQGDAKPGDDEEVRAEEGGLGCWAED